MFYRLLFFALLCLPSSGYTPQTACSGSTFGKCLPRSYCGVTDTGAYECLPCTANNLCPGDGYIYTATQLNRQIITLNNVKYVANSTYIVSRNRGLLRKKLKKIGKIVKVGLTVAAIAKTGGVAALKKAAAAKAKEFAIKKGIQCLKNGLSNFCNGKKKGTISKGKVLARVKAKLPMVKAKLPMVKAKLPMVKAKLPMVKAKLPMVKAKTYDVKGKTRFVGVKKGAQVRKSKTSVKKRIPSKTKSTRSSKSKPIPRVKRVPPSNPCKNIFDTIAEKVNNATRHVVDKTVNKGRDWLKRNIGGTADECGKRTNKPKNLRGSKSKPSTKSKFKPTTVKGTPKSNPKSSSTNDDATNSPTSDDNTKTNDDSTSKPRLRPKARPPVATTDDSLPKRKPASVKHAPSRVKRVPVTKTDDNLLSTMAPTPKPRPIKKRVRAIAPVADDIITTIVPTSRPVKTKAPIIITDDSILTASPSTKQKLKQSKRTTRTSRPTVANFQSRMPTSIKTRIPTSVNTKMPTRFPTMLPTRVPTRSPTRSPTPMPTTIPSQIPSVNPTTVAGPPTMIPISGGGISWAIFSTAPVSQTSFVPTRVPTISMFSIISISPSIRPTIATSASLPTSIIGEPSLRPTILVTSINPSFRPSPTPTIMPITATSFAPSVAPSTSPTIQTTANSLSSSGQTSTTTSSTQTYAIVSVFVGLIIFAALGFCAFQLFKKRKSPFQKWVDVYDLNTLGAAGSKPNSNQNDEIYHFYRKDPSSPQNSRVSINRNNSFSIPPNMRESSPAFVPYVPKKESRRYSHQTMVQINNRL